MADEETREQGGAEQAPPEAPVEEAGAEDAPAKGEPKVAAPLCEERLVEVRFVRDTNWCVATAEGSFIEPLAAGEKRTLPWETAQVFVGMGAAVWAGDEELAVKGAGEVATRSRRRRK
jgi:hypothetical protein